MESAEFGTFLVTLPFPMRESVLVTKSQFQERFCHFMSDKKSISKRNNPCVALKSNLINMESSGIFEEVPLPQTFKKMSAKIPVFKKCKIRY